MCFQLCRTCSSPAKCFPFTRRYQQGCASNLKTDPSAAPSSKPYRAKYHVPTPCHILGVPPCSSTGKPLDLNMMLVWGLCWCGQHYIKLWKSTFSFPMTSHTQVAKVSVYNSVCLASPPVDGWRLLAPFVCYFAALLAGFILEMQQERWTSGCLISGKFTALFCFCLVSEMFIGSHGNTGKLMLSALEMALP